MGKLRFILIVAALFLIVLGTTSGGFLVINQPRKSDVIVALAGETDKRLAGALQLLNEGYAPQLILDVPGETRIYGTSQVELAQNYVASLPQAVSITVCPVYGRSTRDEVRDVTRCLQGRTIRSILLVTSDYHTRRALSIFSRASPGNYSVAAVYDEREFGVRWWRHRQWAKVNFEEWVKLIWWGLVDHWRH